MKLRHINMCAHVMCKRTELAAACFTSAYVSHVRNLVRNEKGRSLLPAHAPCPTNADAWRVCVCVCLCMCVCAHLCSCDCLYSSAKSTPSLPSSAGVVTSNIHVAGFRSAGHAGTPGKDCRHTHMGTHTQANNMGVTGCRHAAYSRCDGR